MGHHTRTMRGCGRGQLHRKSWRPSAHLPRTQQPLIAQHAAVSSSAEETPAVGEVEMSEAEMSEVEMAEAARAEAAVASEVVGLTPCVRRCACVIKGTQAVST